MRASKLAIAGITAVALTASTVVPASAETPAAATTDTINIDLSKDKAAAEKPKSDTAATNPAQTNGGKTVTIATKNTSTQNTGNKNTDTQNTGNKNTGTTPAKQDTANQGSSIDWSNPKEIKEWIGVITAVLGLLGTIFAALSKFMPTQTAKPTTVRR